MQASGGQDRVVHVWGVRTNLHRHTFRGHKDGVTVSLGSEGGGRGGRDRSGRWRGGGGGVE